MRKCTVIATGFALGLGLASLAGAAENSRATRGWVSSVDLATKTFKVKGKNDVVAFKLEDAGKVMEKAKPATFADLKAGEHVMVRYVGTGPDRVASEVDILAAHAQAPAAKTAASTTPAPKTSN